MGPQEKESRDAVGPKGHSCMREPGCKMAWRERLGLSDPESRARVCGRQGSVPGVLSVLEEWGPRAAALRSPGSRP